MSKAVRAVRPMTSTFDNSRIVDELVADLDAINDRAQLVGLLAPLSLPPDLPEVERQG